MQREPVGCGGLTVRRRMSDRELNDTVLKDAGPRLDGTGTKRNESGRKGGFLKEAGEDDTGNYRRRRRGEEYRS